MGTIDANGDLRIQTPVELFDAFIQAADLSETIAVFRQLCSSLDINPKNYKTIYQSLKNGLTSWKARSLWTKLDKRVEHKDYTGKPCSRNKVLVIGAGPCGLRVAIEAALLGAQVVVLEKREKFSRNNVLHLWPYLITDLKNLGAKKFFGQFCAGSLDHISIKRLQLILLKVCLLFGVQVYPKVAFGSLVEPKNGQGWRASIDPPSSPLNKFEFDIVVGADGRRQALKFKGKEFRGKLAIGITANFVNRNSKEEAQVEEISGVAFIFNQGFFQDLKEMTGIDLENIVYYKDETHYFVMCAKKQSLLMKGVIKKDLPDAYDLLHPKNVNHDRLLTYAREAAEFSTKFQMPHMDFAVNHQGKEDVAMFDFTSLFAAENSVKIYERQKKKLLAVVVGDSLLEPFWPTGSGCARGFLGCFDAAWAMKGFGQGKKPLDIIAERENIYRILAQTTPENLNKNFDNYGINPDSRYTNYARNVVKPSQVKHLYDSHEGPIDHVDGPEPMDTTTPIEPEVPEVNLNIVLKWCQEQTKGYKNVKIKDMSTSWKDGLAFCAIIHRFRPDLIDFASLDPNDVEENNQLAFETAEGHLGILPQISAKEIATAAVPDQLTILSYVTQYYETFKNETPVAKKKTKEENEKSEYKTTSPLSKLSIISRMSRKKEKRKSESNSATVVSKKIKQSSKENIAPPSPKTPEPEKPTPIEVEPVKQEPVIRTKPGAKTSNRISLLAEQVFGAKDGATVVPNLPACRDTGSEHCYFCNRWVYLMERMSAEGLFFHRECFKCELCLNTLRLGAYSYIPPWESDDERGHFYCRPHYYKVINSSIAEDDKLRKASQIRNQKKRRGKSFTISNPQETRAAVHEAAKRIKNQKEEKKKLDQVDIPLTNGEVELKKPEKPVEKEKKVAKNEDEQEKEGSLERNRPNSGRFVRLEARPIRRSSISSTRKSDKTVRSKAKGYKLDGELLDVEEESGARSPIRVPSPTTQRFDEVAERESRVPESANDSAVKKKLEKKDSAEEVLKGAMNPSGLDKVHRLGTVERKRRQRRAMYPPLSQVFSPEDSNKTLESEKNGEDLSIEDSLRKTGMNVKVVDIDIDENNKAVSEKVKVSNAIKIPKQKGPTTATPKQNTKPPSPNGVTKQSPTSKSPPGSLVSSRVARIRGLMDNDIRPKNVKSFDRQVSQEGQANGQELQQKRSLPRVPSNEEPYTSTKESTKIAKRRPTPKPKANVCYIEREVNGVQENVDKFAKDLGYEVVGYHDIPSPYRKAPPKPPRSFKREKDESCQDVFSGSSEDDVVDNEISGTFQRAGARRYKNKGVNDLPEDKKKRHEQAKIRIAMKQRQSKRLRRAQQIQRELQEVEVKQAEVEKDGVLVEKALRSGDLSPRQEQQYMMQWFQIINRKNTLLRYESELVIHGNSIQLEDQQGRLEQEIRELLMKDGATKEDQVTIQQKTKELVDIVEQRNNLVELLDEDRKREQEEDRAFEEMMATKGFITSV